MFYESTTSASAIWLGSGKNGKAASSQVQDHAVGVIVGVHTGAIEVLDGAVVESQIACETALNPDWTKQLKELAKGIVKVAAAGVGAAGGATAVIGAILGSPSITDVTNGLIGVITTPKHLYTGFCGTKTNTEVLINKSKDIFIEPNMAVILLMTSGQRLEVNGKKHWQSDASVNSNSFIGTFIYQYGNAFGTHEQKYPCCTKNAGIYLQTGLTDQKESQNRYKLDNYYYLMGNNWETQYLSGGNPITFGSFGRIFGEDKEGCKDMIIAQKKKNEIAPITLNIIQDGGINIAQIPSDYISGNWEVYDVKGASVARGRITDTKLVLNNFIYPVGNLFILKISKDNNSLTQKFVNNGY